MRICVICVGGAMSRDRTAAKARDAAPASRARAASVWTPERVAAVCKRHAGGTWLKHACALEGGSYEGLRDAAAADPTIRAAIDEAHAKGGEVLRARMLESGVEVDDDGRTIRTGDWKREAWLLERWDQATFHLTTKVEAKQEHSTPGGGPLQIVVGSIEELRALAKGASKDGGE